MFSWYTPTFDAASRMDTRLCQRQEASGGMAEWRNGGMADRRNGGLAGGRPSRARPSPRALPQAPQELRTAASCRCRNRTASAAPRRRSAPLLRHRDRSGAAPPSPRRACPRRPRRRSPPPEARPTTRPSKARRAVPFGRSRAAQRGIPLGNAGRPCRKPGREPRLRTTERNIPGFGACRLLLLTEGPQDRTKLHRTRPENQAKTPPGGIPYNHNRARCPSAECKIQTSCSLKNEPKNPKIQ